MITPIYFHLNFFRLCPPLSLRSSFPPSSRTYPLCVPPSFLLITHLSFISSLLLFLLSFLLVISSIPIPLLPVFFLISSILSLSLLTPPPPSLHFLPSLLRSSPCVPLRKQPRFSHNSDERMTSSYLNFDLRGISVMMKRYNLVEEN